MNKNERDIDLIILGAGPAGLTAGIYAARAKLDTLIFENELVGGQVTGSYSIENYPGFEKIGGAELSEKMSKQAKKLGAVIDEFSSIERITLSDSEKIVETGDVVFRPKSVIISVGARSRRLPIPEEDKFHGKAIHYCALCDGAMYEGKEVVIIGGGNSALEAANFMTRFTDRITIVHQFDKFQGSQAIQNQVMNQKNIKIIWDSEVDHVLGEDRIEKIIIKNVKTGERSEISADGMFVFIGAEPQTGIFNGSIELNKWGYIIADSDMHTNIKGVFAAGDVIDKKYRQITTAISDGTIAALEAEKYIKGIE